MEPKEEEEEYVVVAEEVTPSVQTVTYVPWFEDPVVLGHINFFDGMNRFKSVTDYAKEHGLTPEITEIVLMSTELRTGGCKHGRPFKERPPTKLDMNALKRAVRAREMCDPSWSLSTHMLAHGRTATLLLEGKVKRAECGVVAMTLPPDGPYSGDLMGLSSQDALDSFIASLLEKKIWARVVRT